MHATIKAQREPSDYIFRAVPAGTYAVSAFHDSNADGKLNTLLGVPTEGFAFSRNPSIRARAPRFNETSFSTDGAPLDPLKMKYLL